MANLNLTDQAALAGPIQTRINQLRTALELRKEIWNRLSPKKKKAWIVSDKDPIMSLAWTIYRYLRDNFFADEEQYG